MTGLSILGRLLERRARMKGYRTVRTELEGLSDADLEDMGIRRYQLGHMARVKALS
ncbi:MAG: DUF1127 domain-containing protein [Hyphomicrobiales bacterium]